MSSGRLLSLWLRFLSCSDTQLRVKTPKPIRVTHLFTLSGSASRPNGPPLRLGGRFGVHNKAFERRQIRATDIGDGDHLVSWVDEGRKTQGTRARLKLLVGRDGVALLSMVTEHASFEETIAALYGICHLKDTLKIDGAALGVKLSEYGVAGFSLDVHQQVQIRDDKAELPALVARDGKPSLDVLALLYRHKQESRALTSQTQVPEQLNRAGQWFCIQNRGVSVFSGQDARDIEATLLVYVTLLMGLERLRRIRESLVETVDTPTDFYQHLRLDQRYTKVGELTDVVRSNRLTIANDVVTFVDGSDIPEAVLEEARSGMLRSLGFQGVLDSTRGLLETVSDLAESIRLDADAQRTQVKSSSDSRWNLFVAATTAVTLPLVLLLGYFGVNSDVDLSDKSSVFDLGRYRGPWIVAATVFAAIVFGALAVRRRNRKQRIGSGRVLVSAHRGGAREQLLRENSLLTIDRAASLGAEIVEFDVCACPGSPEFMLAHSCDVVTTETDSLESALDTLRGRAIAHVDIKTASRSDVEAIANRCLAVLGPEGFLVTSLEDETIAWLSQWKRRDWKRRSSIQLGLSLAIDKRDHGLLKRVLWTSSATFRPRKRLAGCGANFIAAQYPLARFRLIRWASRSGVPILVWTPNEEPQLKKMLADKRVWAITTDFPERALIERKRNGDSG
jgi:glycerophosphoryl diester phosphodiesterase